MPTNKVPDALATQIGMDLARLLLASQDPKFAGKPIAIGLDGGLKIIEPDLEHDGPTPAPVSRRD